MISHLFPIDFSLLYLSISCPFLLSPENKSKKYWYVLLFFIFLHSKTEENRVILITERYIMKLKSIAFLLLTIALPAMAEKVSVNTGDVIGTALMYSGNYKQKTVTDDTEYHYFFAGINEQNSEYHLKKGETFKTPALALTYSTEGLSGASRNFHKWGRKYILAHGDKERDMIIQ